MKRVYIGFLSILLCLFINFSAYSQSSQKYDNSLRLQYGLYQYNSNQNNFLDNTNKNFLSLGLTYRHQLNRISGLNFTGRYYEWQLNSGDKLKTYAAQAMWVLHAKRVGNSWRLNRFTPYIGIGVGFEKHNLLYETNSDSALTNLYIPIELGIIYNLSSRLSIGIFGEYKFAGTSDLKKLAKTPEGKLDIVNSAGVSLAWHFGQKKREMNAPVFFTNPNFKEAIVQKAKVENVAKQAKSTETEVEVKKTPIKIEKKVTVEVMKGVKDTIKTKTVTIQDNIETVEESIEIVDKKDKPVIENVIEIDSSKEIQILRGIEDSIQKLNAQIVQKQPVVLEPSTQKDTVFIQPLPSDLADEPIVVQLKESHNKLSKLAEDNYKKGSLNEDELQKIKSETDAIKEDINKISKKEGASSSELAKLYQKIATLENEVEQKNNNTEKSNMGLEKDVKTLQNQLDKMMLELEYLKRNALNNGNISNPNTQKLSEKDPAFELLLRNQDKLEKQLKQKEMENDQLNRQIDKLEKKSNTAEIEKIQKEAALPANDTTLAQILKNQALLQEKLALMESQNNQLKGNIQKLEQNKDIVKAAVPIVEKPVIAPKDTALERLMKNQALLQEKLALMESQNNLLKEKIEKPVSPPVIVKTEPVAVDNTVYTVRFDVNSTTVKSSDKESLKNITAIISNPETTMLLLSGFADKSGNAAYNLKLSQQRVKAVKAELLKQGFKDENLVERFFGSEKSTKDVNENDRKVVIKVLKQ